MRDYEVIFDKGKKLIQENLNMYTLLETLLKIKSTLSVLVGDNQNLVRQIEQEYYKNVILGSSRKNGRYKKFINRDERNDSREKIIKYLVTDYRREFRRNVEEQLNQQYGLSRSNVNNMTIAENEISSQEASDIHIL